VCEMKTMCEDGGIRVQPRGKGVAKAPARPEALGRSSQRLCSELGTQSRGERQWRTGRVAGGRERVWGLLRRGGRGRGRSPGFLGRSCDRGRKSRSCSAAAAVAAAARARRTRS
jgi:hypothetical protein